MILLRLFFDLPIFALPLDNQRPALFDCSVSFGGSREASNIVQ